MRHLGFAAGFVATCAVLVPIAWHPLDASIEKDGKHVRPLQQEFTIDGTRVTLDVDHNLIDTGDPVNATLRAYSDTPKQVKVDVAVYYTDDEWGGRVSSPPKSIDVEHLTLSAAPHGGKPVSTRLVLNGTGKVNTFRIFAYPHGRLLDIWGGGEDDHTQSVAAIPVLGWSGDDFAISIRKEGRAVAGQPFTVAVRIENTTGKRMKVPYIELGTQVALSGVSAGDDFAIEDADASAGDHEPKTLRPGGALVKKFTVTPQDESSKQVTLIARAFIYPEDIGKIEAGAMDAKTFQIAHPKPADAKVAKN